jgi:Transposase, Mutator family
LFGLSTALQEEHSRVHLRGLETLLSTPMPGSVGRSRWPARRVAARYGERTEDRATHRNGYRARRWATRAGEIKLQIPKIRQGSYFPPKPSEAPTASSCADQSCTATAGLSMA